MTSGLNWRAQLLASSVTWNGKPSRSPTWLRRFNTVSWMTPLFGAICEPFEASRGVDRWIGLLAASRANPIAPRENASAPATTGTFGPTPPGSSKKSDPAASSWRTFQESQGITTSASGQSYEAWVTGLRKDYSRRKKLARRIFGNGSLPWATPTSRDEKDRGCSQEGRRDKGPVLGRDVLNWPTPRATDGSEAGSPTNDNLPAEVRRWPTATVCHRGGRYGHPGAEEGNPSLKLAGAARQWPTAKATDGEKEPGAHRQGDPSLPSAARMFPTPTVTSKNGFDGPNKKNPSRDWDVYSRLARMTSKPGHECSPKCRRLNPLFVEKLMGWPGGWTLLPLGLSDSPFSATEWSRWWRLMRSALLRLG